MLLGDTLAPYLFIICLDYTLRTSVDLMKETGFKLAKVRCRRYPDRTIMDADYADDITILTNRATLAESPLHSLERAAGGIGLHVNVDKTVCMSFNRRGDISTLDGRSLKLVDKFNYLGSSVSFMENDINSYLGIFFSLFLSNSSSIFIPHLSPSAVLIILNEPT